MAWTLLGAWLKEKTVTKSHSHLHGAGVGAAITEGEENLSGKRKSEFRLKSIYEFRFRVEIWGADVYKFRKRFT